MFVFVCVFVVTRIAQKVEKLRTTFYEVFSRVQCMTGTAD